MKFGDFDTLTFDVVGTLIDFEAGILGWFRPTLRRYGVSKTDGEILAAFAAVEDKYQRTNPEKTFTEMCPSSTATWHRIGVSSSTTRTRRDSGTPSGSGLPSPILSRR